MPDSESRVERVLTRVVEALDEQTKALREQAEVMRELAESNHRLADAHERSHGGDEGVDPAHADLARRDDLRMDERAWHQNYGFGPPAAYGHGLGRPSEDDEPSTL